MTIFKLKTLKCLFSIDWQHFYFFRSSDDEDIPIKSPSPLPVFSPLGPLSPLNLPPLSGKSLFVCLSVRLFVCVYFPSLVCLFISFLFLPFYYIWYTLYFEDNLFLGQIFRTLLDLFFLSKRTYLTFLVLILMVSFCKI